MGNASVEERREVAARLREGSGHGLLGLYSAVLGDDAKNRTAVLYKRLADLIDPGEDVSVSAYDLLPEEDRETLQWVNEHGGLENVSDAWDEAVNLCATIGCEPNDASEMLQALGECTDVANKRLMPPGFEWTDAFADAVDFMDCVHDLLYTIDGDEHTSNEMLVEMVKRLMPEGCEWPRYVSGEPVKFGDGVNRIGGDFEVSTIGLYYDSSFSLNSRPYLKGERVKRPAVLAADGEPLEAGQTVYVIANGKTHHVTETDTVSKRFKSMEQVDGSHWLDPMCFTHQRPVLDADGVPCKEGDTVYALCDGSEHVVECVYENGTLKSAKPNSACYLVASRCTHAKPEPPDTWERIEEDAKLAPGDYIEKHGRKTDLYAYEEMPIDLVRRCKALAGVSE